MSKEDKLVPKLRFPEFENGDGWEVKQVNDYFNVGSSKRVLQDDWTSFGVPFYRTRELVSLSKNEPFRSEIFISQELFYEIANKYGLPNEGDFLVSGVGTLGIYYQVKENDKFYFKDGNVIWFKKNKVINSDYFRYCFQSDFIQTQILAQSSASTVGTFTIQNASVTKFYIPKSTIEQQKIADSLSSLDDLITGENEKLAVLKSHKKGLMQQLFPAEGEREPKLRFSEFKGSGDWEQKSLEFLTHKISDGIHTTPVYDVSGEYYFINGNNFINGRIYTDEKTKKVSEKEYIKHKKDLSSTTIFMSINGTIGNIATFNNENIILGKSACYINIDDTKVIRDFIVYLIQTEVQIKYFISELTGSTIKNLSLKSIKDAFLPIPCRREQQEIAECLSALDEQIIKQAQKIDELKLHKKGLMQGLFPYIN